MSRPTDPRRASRRGSDNADLGYRTDIPATPTRGKRWPAPQSIREINALVRQREATGLCVVCHKPAGAMGGATCKSVDCIRAFVMGQVV